MTPEEVTFNNLPEAIAQLMRDNISLQQQVALLNGKIAQSNNGKEVMNVKQAAAFLNKTPSAIYAMICRREIKFHKPDKHPQFFREDLLDWVLNGKQYAIKEASEAVRRNVITINKRKHPQVRTAGIDNHV